MNEQWQNKLRSLMNDHEEAAPKGVWEGIEDRLAIDRSPKMIPLKKRFLIVGTVAAVAVILLLLIFMPNNSEDAQVIFETTEKLETTEKDIPESRYELSEDESISLAEQRQLAEQQQSNTLQAIKQVEISEITSTETNSNVKPVTEETQLPFEKPTAGEQLITVEQANAGDQLKSEKQPITLEQPKTEDKLIAENKLPHDAISSTDSKWQTNISVSNISSGSAANYDGYGTFAQQQVIDNQYDVLSGYNDRSAYTEVIHNQPITMGLMLKYNITNKWSISSGLTYSLLSSKLRSESSNYFYDDRQTLHYLGIPLNIGYTLWQNENLSTYISGGGLVERNIAGKLSSDYYIDNRLELSTTENVTSKHLQWSVNTALGIEYRISNRVGLYAEPGVSYYFKNSSELETIYKDRPFNFNLNLGLRITFND